MSMPQAGMHAAVGGKNWSFVGSTSANNVNIVGPGSCLAGDVAFLFDGAANADATIPSQVVPAGWTLIDSATVTTGTGSCRSTLSYKILASGDLTAGTMNSVTGQSGGSSSRKIIGVFRDTLAAITAITINSLQSQATAGNPSLQTIPVASTSLAALALGHWRTSQLGTFTRTGMTDMSTSDVNVHLAAYRIFNSGHANQNVDCDDSGVFNVLQSFYVT